MMPNNEKKLFLLDAYALIFRAHYAFIKNPRFNTKGLNTSAILGFVNTLVDIINNEKPSHLAVVFDPPSPTFRDKIFPQYKANRAETPPEIKTAVPYIKQILEAFRIRAVEIDGFEADDTIGTLAKIAEKRGFDVYMMTPDKDYAQLVSDNIFIYKPKRSDSEVEILGKKEICEKYQISDPLQFVDILALWGDTADNVPGVTGIGEQTSMKLISKYGSIENLYANLSDLKGKLRENLENEREKAERARFLVTIETQVPVEYPEDEFITLIPDYAKLKELFKELEFNALEKRIIPSNQIEIIKPEKKESLPIKYVTITAQKDFENIKGLLLNKKEFAFHIDYSHFDIVRAEINSISICFEPGSVYLIKAENKETWKTLLTFMKPIFESEKILKIGFSIKKFIQILKSLEIELSEQLFDIEIAHFLLFPEKNISLDQIIGDYFSISDKNKKEEMASLFDIEEKNNKITEKNEAHYILELKKILEKELIRENLKEYAQNIEFPLIPILAEMEINGISLNEHAISQLKIELNKSIKEIEEDIYNFAGIRFNISSTKQLGEVLFEKMKIIDDPKLTKTKQYSTSEQDLSKIADQHPIIEKILEFRTLSKLLNTYVEILPSLINVKTNKIHTTFNQLGTQTGRLSCLNPNLQNIPIKTELGRKIRSCFVPTTDKNILLSADYSQIELRVMAHLSCDNEMIEAFNAQDDFHKITASKIFKTKEVNYEMRAKAKSANFGIIYGISAFGLSENLKISRSEAKTLIDDYFSAFPKVKLYIDSEIKKARNKGFSETLFGRKRKISEINSSNSLTRSFGERIAVNTPVQGTAAEIVKLAMINCSKILKTKFPEAKMLLQVHDELVFEIPESIKEIFTESMQFEMENVMKLNVPLIVSIGTGKNWLAAH